MTAPGGNCRSTHGGGALVGRCAGCTQGAFAFVSKAGGWGSAGICVKKTKLDAAEQAQPAHKERPRELGSLAEAKETPEALAKRSAAETAQVATAGEPAAA